MYVYIHLGHKLNQTFQHFQLITYVCVDISHRLEDNLVCLETQNRLSNFCNAIQQNASISIPEINCRRCDKGKEPNPSCSCVYPLIGKLDFRSPSFSGYSNNTNFKALQQDISNFFKNHDYPVDSVAIRNIQETAEYHLLIDLLVFPKGKEFDDSGMQSIIFVFSSQTYKPPPIFGPYIFKADQYSRFTGMMKLATHVQTNSIWFNITHFFLSHI